MLNRANNRRLGKHGALTIAARAILEPLADAADVDEAAAVQLMRDDVVPRGAGGEQPLAVVRGDDAVRGDLVGVVLQHLRVKVCRLVLHRPRRVVVVVVWR